jgi:hypothetical protein
MHSVVTEAMTVVAVVVVALVALAALEEEPLGALVEVLPRRSLTTICCSPGILQVNQVK